METLLCPRTRTPLKKVTLDGITLDISEACGGVWFDNFELRKFADVEDSAGDALVELLEPYYCAEIDHEERLSCPRCDGIVLMRSFYSPKMQVEIDTCPSCGGVWLDPGDLGRMRALFGSEEEREQYVQTFVEEVSLKELGEMKATPEHGDRKPSNTVLNLVRFITPSRYFRRR